MNTRTKSIITALAILLTTTIASCTKENESVSLRVNLESYRHTTKNYIDDEGYSCWSNGDQVRINDEVKNIQIIENQCRIYNVSASESYTAFYPASLATTSTTISNSEITNLTLPAIQVYSTADGRQMVPTVMAAHLSFRTGVINFYNACIALKITLTNNYSRTLLVSSVKVSDNSAPLNGTFNITGIADGTPSLSYAGTNVNDENKHVTLQLPDNGITLYTNNTTTLYIILPPTNTYSDNKFTVEVTALDYEDMNADQAVTVYEFSHTQSSQANGAIGRNVMAPIDILLDEPHTLVLNGKGTETNPYKISTVDDLRSMQHLVNAGHIPIGNDQPGQPFASAYYQLTGDIAVNNTSTDMLLPIGTQTNHFTGYFDGGNHTISGIYASSALFGHISQNAHITNLTINNATIDMSNSPVGGVICAYADRAVIDHCRVTGAVSFNNIPTTTAYMGGIVGEATALTNSNSNVTNCHCAASITLNGGNSAHRLGGIAGHLNNSFVANCYTQVNDNTATATTMTIGNAYVGGIVGRCDGGSSIVNCYYGIYEAINGTDDHFADICGEINNSTRITYCYYSHRIHAIGTPTEQYIQRVYHYDLNNSNSPQYAVGSQHIGTLLRNTANTLHYNNTWSIPSSFTEAPQLSF